MGLRHAIVGLGLVLATASFARAACGDDEKQALQAAQERYGVGEITSTDVKIAQLANERALATCSLCGNALRLAGEIVVGLQREIAVGSRDATEIRSAQAELRALENACR